ncbi:hypothetical protein [Neisseria shayeganii]|nr:hypothetical protein [Neisseria shayeganii]
MPSETFIKENKHQLYVSVNEMNRYASFDFSSRLAMYEFGREIMHEAIFGKGGLIEFYPMIISDGKLEIINGTRMSLESARIFINYPDGSGE